MARGTVIGEKPVSQAQTKAFDENWDRMKHSDDGERGRFVYDPVKKCLVRPGQLAEARALDAPIMMDRFYENTKTTDGRDVGSRKKYKQFLKDTGTTHASDYGLKTDGSVKEGSSWDKAEKTRKDYVTTGGDHKERRDQIGRALYEIEKKRARR